MSTPEKYCSLSSQIPTTQQEVNDNKIESEKERHSSGDSALSSSPPPSTNKTHIVSSVDQHQREVGRFSTEAVPTRGILKTSLNRGRSYSESIAIDHSRLMESASMVSVNSSIPEEQEDEDSCFMNGNGECL
jgi:hypothetical protein